jgi:hypothetical protein
VLKEAVAEFRKYATEPFTQYFEVSRADETWEFDNENEFFADYRRTDVSRAHRLIHHQTDGRIILTMPHRHSSNQYEWRRACQLAA